MKKNFKKFLIWMLVSYAVIELVVHWLGLKSHLEVLLGGLFGTALFFGIKLHIFCCVIPAAAAVVIKCRCHKNCDHSDHGEEGN